jgi:hypothetical protein
MAPSKAGVEDSDSERFNGNFCGKRLEGTSRVWIAGPLGRKPLRMKALQALRYSEESTKSVIFQMHERQWLDTEAGRWRGLAVTQGTEATGVKRTLSDWIDTQARVNAPPNHPFRLHLVKFRAT